MSNNDSSSQVSIQTTCFCAGSLSDAKVLVIGHDPRLQVSDTLASKAFFADYYFGPIPTRGNERAKYKLAEAVFGYIGYLTSYKYSAYQIVLTNLCNAPLSHAPKGKTVYISEERAHQGIDEICNILSRSGIDIIFAMSLQVNYWLQKLGFYPALEEFLSLAGPKQRGVSNELPYYEPIRGRAFTLICGKQYTINGGRSVFPILHVKNWPLKDPFVKAYAKSYEACINSLK